MSRLLKKTSVHSALRHDQIVAGGTNSADIQLIEDEADAVAKRASDVLKRSKRWVKNGIKNRFKLTSF